MAKKTQGSETTAQTTVPQKSEKPMTLSKFISSDKIKARIEEVLGKRASVFAASVIQISQQSEMLAKADPASVVGAAMTAATLDLPLNNSIGQAYIVPYNTTVKMADGSKQKVVKAQFILGYKGLKQLAMRSGMYKNLNYGDVREGEIASQDRLSGEIEFNWEQDEDKREKLKVIGYFSYYKLLNGFTSMYYMSVKEIDKHAKKYSATYKFGKGNWKDDFESMAIKTVIKLHLNKGEAPLSIEMQSAIEKDQSSVSVDEEGQEFTEYVDVPVEKVEPDHEDERLKMFIANSKTEKELRQAISLAKTDEHKQLINERAEKLQIKL